MRSWVLALAWLAACGGQGLDIEVHGDAPFDAVELYIAYDTCQECAGVGWPGSQQSTAAESVYLLRDDERVVRTTNLVADNTAVLHLEAAAGFDKTTAIAVVAYKGSEIIGIRVLYDKAIPRDDQEKWQVDLKGITRASEDTSSPPASGDPAYRALAWPREASTDLPDPTDYASCLAYQEWDGSNWKTQFFVPATDTDCDGAPPDCDPLWAHRPVGSAKCVTHPSVATLAGACVLGAQACVDESTAQACTPTTTPLICMPNTACTSCADSDNLISCIKNVVSSNVGMNPAVPVMNCTFIPDPNALTPDAPCMQAPFGTERMTFSVPGMCSTGTTNAVLRPLAAPFSGGSPTIMIGGTASMTVHATPGSGNCDISIDWTEGAGTNPQVVLLALQYTGRQVLIPLAINFRAGTCPAAPTACMQTGEWPNASNGNPGDSVFACTKG